MLSIRLQVNSWLLIVMGGSKVIGKFSTVVWRLAPLTLALYRNHLYYEIHYGLNLKLDGRISASHHIFLNDETEKQDSAKVTELIGGRARNRTSARCKIFFVPKIYFNFILTLRVMDPLTTELSIKYSR